MLDNVIFKELIQEIKTGLTSLGLPSVGVKRSYQPTQQGTNSAATVYVFKLFDERMGSAAVMDIWDEDNQEEVHTETQQYVTHYQVSALVRENPADTTGLTASDLCNYVSAILQSRSSISALQSKGLGVLKVNQIRNPYFVDDKGQNEASPSFDFQLTHKQVIITRTPVFESIDCATYRV